jgi:hypothetical protein
MKRVGRQDLADSKRRYRMKFRRCWVRRIIFYAFQKFEEAIKILQEVVIKMPELPEPLTTLSSIYGKYNAFHQYRGNWRYKIEL